MMSRKKGQCRNLFGSRFRDCATGAGAMFLLVIIFFQLVISAHSLCVWQNGEGVKVACGFRQSNLFRLRNFGGVKSWAGLGFSVGDEDNFKESLTNVEQAEAESRAYKDKGVFGLREPRGGEAEGGGKTVPYTFYLNEDENSDEIPEDSDRRKRRYGTYDDLLTTTTTTTTTSAPSTPNPAEKVNSFEKRSGQGHNSSSSSTGKILRKMTVSVNIPEFAPLPLDFELSDVKVSSKEKDTIDKYLKSKPTTLTPVPAHSAPTPKINLSKFYKKPVAPVSKVKGGGSKTKSKKKPFRIQLLENTEQIADGYKYNTRRGTDRSQESTLLIPTASASIGSKPQKLSKALLQQHVKKGLLQGPDDVSDEPAEQTYASSSIHEQRTHATYSRPRQFNKPLASMSLKDVEKHLLTSRQHAHSGQRPKPVLTRGPPSPPGFGGNRRSYPREKGPRPGPPPSNVPPRNHRRPGPGGPRNPPSRKPPQMEPTAFSKHKVQTFHGPPPSDNSVRLPLAVLRKYLPKTFSWPGRNNPHGKRPGPKPNKPMQMHNHPNQRRQPVRPRPRPSGERDSHVAGSINHHYARPQRLHAPVPKFPSDAKKTVVLPVPVGPPRPMLPNKHKPPVPSVFSPSPAVYEDGYETDAAGWRPGLPDAFYPERQPPSVETPATNEKESILHALKTLSQARAEVIKSIVKEGALPHGVINIASNTNETASPTPGTAQDSDVLPPNFPRSQYMSHPPTPEAPLPAILPMIVPTAGAEQQQESIRHYEHQYSAEYDAPEEQAPQEQIIEQEADESEMYTEKINSISAKLSELPDNEEFITLPIDDVLSMLLATTKQTGSEEKSKEYVSTYFGVNKDLQQQQQHQGRSEDEDEEDVKLNNKQTELGRILYDMGIIHRIAAGNLTVPQMAILNKLIDLNQNERVLGNEDEDHFVGDEPDVQMHESVNKKQPAKYIIPTTSTYSGPGSYRPFVAPTTTITTTTTTTPAPTTRRTPPAPPAHEYTYDPYRRGIVPTKNYASFNTPLSHLKSEYGSVIDEKVRAALQEYNAKQNEKNRNLFSKRGGQPSVESSDRERVSSSKSKYQHEREHERDEYRSRSSSSSGFSKAKYAHSERRSSLSERERERGHESSRPSSSRKRVLETSPTRSSSSGSRSERRRERKDPDEHVVIIRPSASRRRSHHHSSSSWNSKFSQSHSHSSSAPSSKDRSSAPGSAPVLVDLDSIF